MVNAVWVRVPSGVPFFQQKQNMVDIAQLVSASDCGSEGRGFESHYPPQKNRRYLRISPVFIWFWADNGIRKAVKKTCRWHVFRPWESPWNLRRIWYGCGSNSNISYVLNHCYKRVFEKSYKNTVTKQLQIPEGIWSCLVFICCFVESIMV